MNIVHVTNDTFETEVLRSEIPVLVDFYADWCGPCKMLAPILEELSRETDAVKIAKVNVDDADRIAADYSVMSIPTLILFRNGQAENRTIGFQSKEQLLQFIG